LSDITSVVCTDDVDAFTHVFFQQFLRRQQIKIKILLDYRKFSGRIQAAQQRRFGSHARAYIAESQRVVAAAQSDLALVFHQRKVLVVNGNSHALLIPQSAAQLFLSMYGSAGK
jgi:hypothetical protein